MTTADERYVGQIGAKIYDLHEREARIDFARDKWEKFICNFAVRFKNSVSGYDDFIQEAQLLLIKAADRWIPEEHAARYETFAFIVLRNGLIDFSSRNRGAVSIPSGSMKREDSQVTTFKLPEDIPDYADPFNYQDLLDVIETVDPDGVAQMYFVEQKTLNEVSELSGQSRSTVHRRINEIKEMIGRRIK